MIKVKGFKRFIKEDIARESFNAFVEECFGQQGPIDKEKAQAFITEQDYLYSGDSYRVIWAPTQDILNQKTFKNIAKYISDKFLNDPNTYKFFYTKPEDAVASKIYVKDTQDKTGIIFQRDAKNALDLSKYSGDNDAVIERIEDTHPILYFEPLTISNIFGKIIYDQYTDEGWTLVTDENPDETEDEKIEKEVEKTKEDGEVKPETKPEEKKKDAGQEQTKEKPEEKKKPKSGISGGNKHSKYPHHKKGF